jgi:hypothetical protein
VAVRRVIFGQSGVSGNILVGEELGSAENVDLYLGEQVERFPGTVTLADLTSHPPFAVLSSPIVAKGPIFTQDPHSPRFDVGNATYQRERWETVAPSLPGKSPFAQFVALRVAKRRLGLPRFVFARVASERKPFLVDTDSALAMDLLRHHLRGEKTVSFEEMLPSPDQLFLRDERGRFTFELRIQSTRDH